ncbi:unnamed protein product [Paramecium sonneborni]|uniref:RBR-type E3 ubiquitin transferase n=1 Tax=Paramecium sonneborni TaxID=65129 RepID=A0A8S1LXH0_9CILI|nr:unnamed protein product [Paramecium sonneborni]
MGIVCGKNKKQSYDSEDESEYEYVKNKTKKQKCISDDFKLYSIKRPKSLEENCQMLISEKSQNLKQFNQQEQYQELQNNLLEDRIKQKENLQIILNIYLFCNFKRKEINICFDSINTNIEYKENLKLVGIYRETSLKYHKTETCQLCDQENVECQSLNCQHIFCINCWNKMIEIQLSNYIPIVKCLQNQCQERLPHEYLELNQTYREILVKRMLENLPSYTWCPGIDCERVYQVQQISLRYQCECGVKFCSNCKTESHYPISCQIYQKITEFKEPMQSWIKLDIFQCPNCKIYIQKNQGCIQIQCVCGIDFCSKCLQFWNKEHGKNFYNCSFQDYNKNPSKLFVQMFQKESSITKIISELNYYQKLLNQQLNGHDQNLNDDEQIKKNDELHQYKNNLKNLKTFLKFEKIAIYFTYYLNEVFTENELDHQCQRFSQEILYYYEIVKNQLQGILIVEQQMEKKEKINFQSFKSQTRQIDKNLNFQKKCLKKEILRIQSEKQQNAQQ